jgi:hypothetical protein
MYRVRQMTCIVSRIGQRVGVLQYLSDAVALLPIRFIIVLAVITTSPPSIKSKLQVISSRPNSPLLIV